MSKLAVTSFTAPATQTLQAVADAITTQTGVAIEFDAGIDTTGVIETPIAGNCRDALTRITECVMGYATETNTGSIRVARFSVTPTAEYNAADMVTLPAITDINFEITGVQAITNTGVFETGTPNVSVESNYITESLFNRFASGLVGIEYRPGTVSLALGDPRIEPSDVLSVTVDSDVYVVPCFSITHTFDGGLQTEIVTPSVQNVGKVTGTLSQAVEDAKKKAEQAAEDADDAKKVATSYLSRDASGFMVANMTGAMIYTPGTVPTGVINAFISASAFQVRDGQTVLASYGTEAAIYTKDGTELAHFGYAEGKTASGTTYIRPYYTFGTRTRGTDIGNYSLAAGVSVEASGYGAVAMGRYSRATGILAVAMGDSTEASGDGSTAIGYDTTASGLASTALGDRTTASGQAATAMGSDTTASGLASTALGSGTTASGQNATASGQDTTASGPASYAGGYATAASGDYSHAEGTRTTASGDCSHAEGSGTIAGGKNQTALGRYNVEDVNDEYAVIVGNGSGTDSRSNLFALGWNGDSLLYFNTAASSGTLDAALYDAIVALGWDSDVIV